MSAPTKPTTRSTPREWLAYAQDRAKYGVNDWAWDPALDNIDALPREADAAHEALVRAADDLEEASRRFADITAAVLLGVDRVPGLQRIAQRFAAKAQALRDASAGETDHG